ncbi:MAG: DUF3320 domain-containing protein [Candidatus Coatesbacteria bacterium]|nr:DUF3320 domain-containing protein [Candidatus Coatesbacteria bacterium]
MLRRNFARRIMTYISFGKIKPTTAMTRAKKLHLGIRNWSEKAKRFSWVFPMINDVSVELCTIALSQFRNRANEVKAKVEDLLRISNGVLMERRENAPVKIGNVQADLSELEAQRRFERELSARSAELKEQFGPRYTGIDTDWNGIIAALEWVEGLLAFAKRKELTASVLDYACQGGTAVPPTKGFSSAIKKTTRTFKEVADWFAPELGPFGKGTLPEVDLQSVNTLAQKMQESISQIERWIDYRNHRSEAEELGLSAFLDEFLIKKLLPSSMSHCLEKALYTSILDDIFDRDERLGRFRRISHDEAISRFRELDARLVELRCNEITAKANSRRPQQLIDAPGSEEAILGGEAKKKCRHRPVRKLLADIPNLLPRLKPCLMMSPISVSSYLPAETVFDLVVFDEASQILPWDATVAIYRGKQVLLAGDNKQLPPSSFFDKGMTEDEGDSDDINVFESILDSCGWLRDRMLRWHYRSKHEALIAFSNRAFYGNKLITFPSSRQEDPLLGVEFEYVPDGIYDRGGSRRNEVEAQRVAEIVIDHLERFPTKKFGVVAFSQAQQEAIKDRLEYVRKDRPELDRLLEESDDRLQGFFVKNLENVQGDERDIMIFSVGYGKDADGRMTQNFGPLNKEGGERRLNVAITRAKEKVIVVSSIRKGDVNCGPKTPRGVLHLHRYLDYAERGVEALRSSLDASGGDFESDFEADVAGEIRAMGYEIVPQVGCSSYRIDIGVLDPESPGRFLLGVECDGAMYHSSATARDRDRIRQAVLEGMGWKLYRVWSPTWIKHRKKEIERLKFSIESVRANPPPNPSSTDTERIDEIAKSRNEYGQPKQQYKKVPVIDVREIPGTIPYRVIELPPVNDWHRFGSPASISAIRDRMRQIVFNEGPIHRQVAELRVARLWGASKVGRQMRETFDDVIGRLKRDGVISVWKQFLLTSGMNRCPVRVPVANEIESQRKIDEISPHEIAEAIFLALRHLSSIEEQRLIEAVARIFGFERTGPRIQKRLKQVMSSIAKEGRIQVSDGRISLVE